MFIEKQKPVPYSKATIRSTDPNEKNKICK
jgi:hypothetical protein